jgi:hypothetical protein
MAGLLTEHYHLKGNLFKLGLVDSPGRERCKQTSEMASHAFCDCEALAVLWFMHLGNNFLKPGDFTDISISKGYFVQSEGLLVA